MRKGNVLIRIAIVEDEEKYRKTLISYINKYTKEHMLEVSVDLYDDGDEISEKYSCQYDVIFMDIMMQFMDGMTAAEKIRESDENVIIIFITNMVNYAIKGYQVGAFDYILKPITYFSVSKSFERALAKIPGSDVREFITISLPSGSRKVIIKEICRVESEQHYLHIVTKKDSFRTYMRLKDMEEALASHDFFKINKGILVNLRYVDGIEGENCIVNGEYCPISRRKKKEFLETLNDYMNGSW